MVTNGATVGGTLGVTGNTTLKGTLSSGAATPASAAVTDTLDVDGATTTVASPTRSSPPPRCRPPPATPLSVARWEDRQHHPQGHLGSGDPGQRCGDRHVDVEVQHHCGITNDGLYHPTTLSSTNNATAGGTLGVTGASTFEGRQPLPEMQF